MFLTLLNGCSCLCVTWHVCRSRLLLRTSAPALTATRIPTENKVTLICVIDKLNFWICCTLQVEKGQGGGVSGSWGSWLLCGHNRGVTLHPSGNYWYHTALSRIIVIFWGDSGFSLFAFIFTERILQRSYLHIVSKNNKKLGFRSMPSHM